MSFVGKWGFFEDGSTFASLIKFAPRGSYLRVEEPMTEHFDGRVRTHGHGFLYSPVRTSIHDEERRVKSA